MPGKAEALSKTTLGAAVCAGTAAWASFGLLALTGAEGARRIGVLPSVWLLALAIVLAIAFAAVLRLSARASLPLFLSAVIVLPWLPLPLPSVCLAVTGGAVRLVWIAIAFSMIAVCVPAVAVWRSWSWLRDPRVAPGAAAVLAFAIFLAARSGQRPPPTGDEPHYLLIAQSLLADHDVQVQNNYEREDYRSYFGGFLAPHLSRPGIRGDVYSLHAPGLPAVIAPAFAIGRYWGVVAWIAVLVAIGTAFVWRAAFSLTNDPGAAWFGWAVVTVTIPGALLGSLVYPDAVAGALLAAGAFALVIANRPDGPTLSRPALVALGLTAGVLPWLHTRLALPATALIVVLLIHVAGDPRFRERRVSHLLALATPFLLVIVCWLLFFHTIYGTFSPTAPYGGGLPLDVRRITAGMLGLLTDQEFGLLFNAPVHLVSLGGLWVVLRRSRRLGIELSLLVVPYAIATSAYPLWWAGYSPPARLLTPIVFPLGLAAAVAWAGQRSRGRAVSLTLLGASAIIALVLAFGDNGVIAYNESTGRARWLDWASPLVDLPRALPSFFRHASASSPEDAALVADLVWPAAIWAVALVAGWILFVAFDRRVASGRWVRALVAPACAMLAAGLALTVVWRVNRDVPLTATRAQLALLRGQNPSHLPFGLQVFPARALPAAAVPLRLQVSTSRIEPAAPGTLLQLTDVPPGSYRARVTLRTSGAGELTLGVGRASAPAARWNLASDSSGSYAIDLPVSASRLVIAGDDEARKSVERVVLVPQKVIATLKTAARARDAARYGSTVVYALDDRVSLEPLGFFVMGQRQPDVLFAPDQPISSLTLEIRNGPLTNRVRVQAGEWSGERVLAAAERWPIRIPVGPAGASPLPGAAARPLIVNFRVEQGYRPAHFDPSSGDRRFVGCWVEVR